MWAVAAINCCFVGTSAKGEPLPKPRWPAEVGLSWNRCSTAEPRAMQSLTNQFGNRSSPMSVGLARAWPVEPCGHGTSPVSCD
jgi:hypothetical protein